MKLTVNRDKFLIALQVVSGAIPSRSPRPILQDVKLVIDNKKMEVIGTDTEVGIRYFMEAEKGKGKAVMCLPASKLKEIITEIQDESVEIDIEGNTIHILAKGRDFKINGDNSEEYPEVPAFEEADAIEMDKKIFSTMIRKTIFATAKEQMRYTLNGVYMLMEKDKLEMAATDRRRLAVARSKIDKVSGKIAPVIIPTKALQLTEKILASGEDKFTMNITNTRVLIKSGQAELGALLIEGNFPAYKDVVPKGLTTKLTLNKNMLAQVVKQARLLTSDETRAINLEFGGGKLTVTSRSSESGEAKIEEPVEYDGEVINISFNPDFLLDVLRVMDTDDVIMEMKDSSKAGIIREGTDFFCVIMPIRPQE